MNACDLIHNIIIARAIDNYSYGRCELTLDYVDIKQNRFKKKYVTCPLTSLYWLHGKTICSYHNTRIRELADKLVKSYMVAKYMLPLYVITDVARLILGLFCVYRAIMCDILCANRAICTEIAYTIAARIIASAAISKRLFDLIGS